MDRDQADKTETERDEIEGEQLDEVAGGLSPQPLPPSHDGDQS